MATFVEPAATSLQQNQPAINARFDAVQNQLGDHQSILNSLQTQVTAMPQAITTCLLGAIANSASGFASSLRTEQTPQRATEHAAATPAMGVRHLAMPPGTAPELCIEGAEMARRFTTATEIYKQFHGIGDEYAGKPVDGGFAKLEASGTSWRAGYNNSQSQHFSKLKRIVVAIDEKTKAGRDRQSVLAEFDALWTTEEVNMNPGKMIEKLKHLGMVKHSSRKRKSAEETARAKRRREHQAASASAPLRPSATNNMFQTGRI